MANEYARALADMRNPKLYERLPGRVVFMEHTRTKPDGQVITVGKKELEEIAATNNKRDAEGDPCLLSLGHTLRGQHPETQQPPPVGYAREFRVQWSPERNKWVITSTYYIRKSDLPYAKTFPRTSVEYWGAEGGERFFDPISLIRRTPELDIGQWTYSATREPLCYARTDRSGRAATVLRYEFEEPPLAEPMTPPADGAAPGTDHKEMAEQFARHCLSHPHAKALADHYAMGDDADGDNDNEPVPPTEPPAAEPAQEPPAAYAAGMVAPSATNAPVGSKPDEYARRQRDQQALQYQRFEQRIKALEDKAAAKDAEIAQYQRQAESEKYEREMIQMEAEGVSLNRADEMEFVMSLPTREHREKYMAKLATAPRAPVQQYGRIQTVTPPRGNSKVDPINDPESVPPEDYAAVERYQKSCGDYESPLHVQLARALPQKYGHLTNGANGHTNGKGV